MKPIQINVETGYEELYTVFEGALQQAQSGKGKERHTDGGDTAFEAQQICSIPRMQGSVDGPLFQAVKKCLEVRNIESYDGKINELYGAINYIAGAIIVLKEKQDSEQN
jgi:hypothetical protein